MIKKIITLAVCLFTSTGFMFGQKFLSQNHAMKRVKTMEKYILLPVEESEGIAHIRVIKDNQVVKEFNCKLSVNKTDYTVPLDVSEFGGDVLLDIQLIGKISRKQVSSIQLIVKSFVPSIIIHQHMDG